MTRRHAGASRLRRSPLTLALAVALAVAGLAPPRDARGDTAPVPPNPPTVSADALPTWQIDGVVWSQVVVGDTVYATGSFSRARPPGVAAGGAGEVAAVNIVAYDIRTGNRVAGFNHTLNAQGRVITASPDGSRVYVGGDFTTVDGAARSHIAAFSTATGALVPTFRPSVNGKVRALSTDATGATVYVGGRFSSVNGAGRQNLAAVRASDGGTTGWAPRVDNGSVLAMVTAPDQSRVIVGGNFTTLNGTAAYGMGSLSTTTGQTLQWEANKIIRNAGVNGAMLSLRTDGTQIYGSGYAFGAGSNFEGTFAANPATGVITLVNDCHGDTYDVLPMGPVLYSVGHAHDCRWIGSFPDTDPRVRWQRALAQTVMPTRTNTGPDNYGWNYAGLPASTVLHWFPDMSSGTYTGQSQGPWSIAGTSEFVVMGGEFRMVNGKAQQGLVRMAVTAIAPDLRGPTYTTNPARPVPATTATSKVRGQVSVTFGTAWDMDNERLTYDLLRDGGSTAVATTTERTNFWTLPSRTLIDTGVASGTKHTYRIRITDPAGNVLLSPTSAAVTVR